MAINFLNKVDLNKNELDHARIVNEAGNTAAGIGVSGQLYFDTTADSGVGVLKVWTDQWVEVGGGVESLTTTQAGNSTGNSITILSSAIGAVTVNAFAYAGASNVGYVPSGGTNTKFLRGDGTWVIPTDTGVTGVTLATGTSTGAPLTESIALRELTLTSMAYDGGTNVGYVPTGGSGTTFLRGDGAWVVPTNDLYTLGKAAGSNNLILKNDGVTQDTIAFNGTTKEIKLDVATADSYTISLADGAFAEWAASGTNLQLPANAVAQTPSSGDDSTRIATTAFVQAAVTGLLEFKGGFNANTGALDSPLTGNLTSGGSRVAIAVGDYYVVTVAGDFFGNTATPLTPGDSVIVQTAAIAGASVEGDFIVVQSDTDLATNSTVGLMFINPTGSGITSNISSGQATLTNSDKGSSQNIFKNVASSSGTAVADNNNDTLTIVGAGSASTAVAGDTLTITATDTNTQYTAGTGLTLNGTVFEANVDGTQTVAANASSTTASRTYKVQVDSSDDLVVNVPWVDNNSGGTISSINATTDGNSLETSNTLTGNGTLTLQWQGNTASYVRGDGSLATFPTIPQGDVTGVTASTTNDEKGIIVASSSGPVPVVGLDIKGQTNLASAPATNDELIIYDNSTDTNKAVTIANLASAVQGNNGYATTITAWGGTITHSLGSFDVTVQLYDDTSKETIYAEIDRTGINTIVVSGNGTFPSTNVRVLVSKVS